MSAFLNLISLMNFVWMSVFWQALFIFKVLLSLIISLELVSLKVKLVLKPLLLIFIILEWFSSVSSSESLLGDSHVTIKNIFEDKPPQNLDFK